MKLASLFFLASLLPALPASAQQIEVHLNPTCGCCKAWVRHLEQAGFTSRVVESQDMGASKRAFRMPQSSPATPALSIDISLRATYQPLTSADC